MASSLIVFGTRCDFTSIVMEKLRLSGHEIRAFVIPGRREHSPPIQDVAAVARKPASSGLPIASPATITARPASPQLPTLELNNSRHPDAARVLAEFDADLSVVCCYPERLPLDIVNATTYGGLNVHPSLLPAYRGPDPLFWIYRNGESQSGVTIHRVDEELDAGAIVRQRSVDVPVGWPGDQLWRECAGIGGDLLSESIDLVVSGNATPVAQDRLIASYYSWPAAEDLAIDPAEWEAWRVYHFCRGVLPFGYMPRITQNGTVRRVIAALEYASEAPDNESSWSGTELIQCRAGAVRLELGPAIF